MDEVTAGLVPREPSHDGPEDPQGGAQHPQVADVQRRLAELDGRPVDEHPGVYADLDDTLREALDSTDQETA